MTTSFLELATTLKYLGAKWLTEKKLILRPEYYCQTTVIIYMYHFFVGKTFKETTANDKK